MSIKSMCWNKTVSALALGIGFFSTVIGIIIIQDDFFTSISIIFLFLLVMQLAELLAYIAYDRKNNANAHNEYLMRYATQLALMGNVGQPLIATLALLPLSTAAIEFKLGALAVATAYAVWICWAASAKMSQYSVISKNMSMEKTYQHEPCRSRCTSASSYYGKRLEYKISKMVEWFFGEKEEDCHSHMVYPWWKEISPVMYIITLGVAILFLIRPLSYMIYQFVAIFLVLLISIGIFNDGQVGSQWCLGVVSLCIINPIAYYILVKKNIFNEMSSDIHAHVH